MKFLPPKAQATMAENQDAKERMSADEYEAFQDAKRKDKNAKKMCGNFDIILDISRAFVAPHTPYDHDMLYPVTMLI